MPARLKQRPLTTNQRKVMGELYERTMGIAELYSCLQTEEEGLMLETVKTAVWDAIAEELKNLHDDIVDAVNEWEIPPLRLKTLSKLLPLELQDRFPTFSTNMGRVQVNKR